MPPRTTIPVPSTNGNSNSLPAKEASVSRSRRTKAGRGTGLKSTELSPGEQLARDHNLIATIQADIAANSVVGEAENALLIYLIYTSRLLERPGAVVTRGPSSLGKSHLLMRVADFFPPSTKIEAMRMTEASLFRTSEDYFCHKILISGERKHATDDVTRDSNAILRQLLSENKICRSVCVPGGEGEGRWVTEWVTRDGPIAYAESTTAGSIFEEDLNRMLQLYLDASAKQTRNVMLERASQYNPDRPKNDLLALYKRHHEFQESLVTCDVRLPYWEQLAKRMPAQKVEARRVIQQVLTVIESIALLHQHQRDRKDGCLLASLEDYVLARRLLLSPIHAILGVGKNYKKAETLRAKLGKRSRFTTPDVTTAMGYKSKMGAHYLLNDLVEAKLISRISKAKGQSPATYEWARNVTWDILPTAKRLVTVTG